MFGVIAVGAVSLATLIIIVVFRKKKPNQKQEQRNKVPPSAMASRKSYTPPVSPQTSYAGSKTASRNSNVPPKGIDALLAEAYNDPRPALKEKRPTHEKNRHSSKNRKKNRDKRSYGSPNSSIRSGQTGRSGRHRKKSQSYQTV